MGGGGNPQTRQKSFTKNIAHKGAEGGYPPSPPKDFPPKKKQVIMVKNIVFSPFKSILALFRLIRTSG